MPRPRKEDTDGMATVRLERAFWSLLETQRYSDITVSRVTREAGTNRNSFYYHYSDIDDLACKAFTSNVDNDVTRTLIDALLKSFREGGTSPHFDLSILPHTRRVMLCARSDSPYLNQLVGDLLLKAWFDSLSIEEELLTAEESSEVRFVSAGLVAVLGSQELQDDPLLMARLFQTKIGLACVATMQAIANRQHSENG